MEFILISKYNADHGISEIIIAFVTIILIFKSQLKLLNEQWTQSGNMCH